MSRELPVQTTLLKNLTELHLPAMRACFEESARRAEKETLSYEQYLLELTGRECEARDRNRIARLLKESSLPHEKTMANFDLKRLPLKVGRQLKVLLDGGFLDRKENHRQHVVIVQAVANGRAGDAVSSLSEHIRTSLKERLDEFDFWKREAALRDHPLDFASPRGTLT